MIIDSDVRGIFQNLYHEAFEKDKGKYTAIVDDPETPPREIISAIRELRAAQSMLWEAMFNSGIFDLIHITNKNEIHLTPLRPVFTNHKFLPILLQ